MYYIIYKTTNLINGKIYIGCHKTKNLDDGYLGSGKLLKRAIEKYGRESFSREILSVFDTPEEMFEMEAKLVNEEFIRNEQTYNLKEGGEGGWDLCISKGLNKNHELTKEDRYKGGVNGANGNSERLIKFHKEGKFRYDNFRGKNHSESTKKKIGEANSKHQKGSGNSQYGKCWIHNKELKQSKSIRKEDIDLWLEDGWEKGRKLKF